MFFDKMLGWLFDVLTSMASVLPDMPEQALKLDELPSLLRNSVFLFNHFMDVPLIINQLMLVIAVFVGLLTWSAWNWVFNKIRGAG